MEPVYSPGDLILGTLRGAKSFDDFRGGGVLGRSKGMGEGGNGDILGPITGGRRLLE